MLRLPISTSTGRTRAGGRTIQPTRQPVIEKYFDSDPTSTAEREDSHALAHRRPNEMP